MLFSSKSALFLALGTLVAKGIVCSALAYGAIVPDPGCLNTEAWSFQTSVKSDTLGIRNNNYPEQNATYWGTQFELPLGTRLQVAGRFPRARYMALQLYDENRHVIDAVNDAGIDPDPGENNPFRTGTEQGRYTIQIVFGRKPQRPAPNTLYTAGISPVTLLYRVYYPTNPEDLTGGTTDPVLPIISENGAAMAACPVRPIVVPEELLVWGRLDNSDFSGAIAPRSAQLPAAVLPSWTLSVTNPRTFFYPSQDNSYMAAVISREYFAPPYNNDLVVIRIKAPTFVNTHAGEPPYWNTTTRQLRFWSVCSDEPQTTGVVRCVPDYQIPLRNGYATVVISDPSRKPADPVLAQHAATWIAWGALLPGDTVYDALGRPMTNADGVFYQGLVLYRQTMPNPNWNQSFAAVGALPRNQWRAAMGDYWPAADYCRAADFAALGAGCMTSQSSNR